jgi:L-ascorbate metabolism protein UlaG (beta-lactamase superfamily)
VPNASALSDAVYLKPEVKLEPLVCGWYAWSHLIGPAQLALHITYRILPLMESFAANPQVHVSANSDPAMYGGPFVDLEEHDVERVRRLIAATRIDCADLIALATELRALDGQLREQASGHSLNDFYGALPASLRGLVELLYDIHHHPSVRMFEPILYQGGLTASTQSIMLKPEADHERAFFMSTPRLPSADSLSFRMRFADRRLDTLAAMRSTPGSFDEVARLFDVDEAQRPQFRRFFQAAAPARRGAPEHQADGVRMRYFGHACVLFQSAGVNVLFDPFVSIGEGDDGRYTINDLPQVIDYVVITHSHQDHFNPEMLIQLRHRIRRVIVPSNNSGHIADPCMRLALRELGFEHIDVLDCFERVELPGGHILSLPFTGEHADLSIYSKQAIVLAMGARKFMFLVDSDGRDVVLYQRIMRQVGPVDALFIGMECHGAPLNWLYEPLLGIPLNRRNNESRRLSGADSVRAWNILAEIKAPRVFVYAMGQEPWMQYIMGLQYTPDSVQLTESTRFIAQCQAGGIDAERLYGNREIVF